MANRDPTTQYATAKGYVQAAFVLMNSIDRFQMREDSTLFLPLHMLWGFALELYLKSFLVLRGFTEQQLQSRAMGHNLMSLAQAAREHGLSLAAIDDLVGLLGREHQKFGYRYPREDGAFLVPNLNVVFAAFLSLDEAVDIAVGASASRGRTVRAPSGAWTLAPHLSVFRVLPPQPPR